MARDSGGTYTVPSGTTVYTGDTIESSWANALTQDIESEITNSLDRAGRGGMTGVFKAVDGTVSAPGLTWGNQTNTGFYRAGSGDVRLSIAGADELKVTASGLVMTHDVTAYSDSRLKQDVKVIKGALDAIGKIRGCTYKRIDRPADGRLAGVIAQDVLAAIPEAVKMDESGMLSVSYAGVIAALVQAVNELQNRVIALEKRG